MKSTKSKTSNPWQRYVLRLARMTNARQEAPKKPQPGGPRAIVLYRGKLAYFVRVATLGDAAHEDARHEFQGTWKQVASLAQMFGNGGWIIRSAWSREEFEPFRFDLDNAPGNPPRISYN